MAGRHAVGNDKPGRWCTIRCHINGCVHPLAQIGGPWGDAHIRGRLPVSWLDNEAAAEEVVAVEMECHSGGGFVLEHHEGVPEVRVCMGDAEDNSNPQTLTGGSD